MGSKEKDRVLILSGAYGEGHQQVAGAIHEALQLRAPHTETVVIDYMRLKHPLIYPFIHYVYINVIKRFPKVYGYLYQKTRKMNHYPSKWKTPPSLIMWRIRNILKKLQPSIVVCTFPFAAGEMSRLKAYGLTTIPNVTIITDYTDHDLWIHPYTEQYIVGANQIQRALNHKGVTDVKISNTGIPIHPKFQQTICRKKLLYKFGMNPEVPTILMMGGGYGMIGGNGLATIQALDDLLPQDYQLMIVCGYNKRLQQRAERMLNGSTRRFHVTGYIDYVHELMAITDLIITKPGGITISEAMAMGVPMVIYNPLPGQEEDNAQFLVQVGVAIAALDPADLCEKVVQLLQNRKQLEIMQANTKCFQLKGSALSAIDVILQARQEPIQTLNQIFTNNTEKRG